MRGSVDRMDAVDVAIGVATTTAGTAGTINA